jgi:hypothetical protein
VPKALPPVSAAPPTAPTPAPIAVSRSCRDMPLQAPRVAATETIATALINVFMISPVFAIEDQDAA